MLVSKSNLLFPAMEDRADPAATGEIRAAMEGLFKDRTFPGMQQAEAGLRPAHFTSGLTR
jgi:hypothetical protein